MGFWDEIAPLGGRDTVRCLPNYTLPGGAMYVYGVGLHGGTIPSYDALRTFEPDGQTPINPATYNGVLADYSVYSDINATSLGARVLKIVRHDISTGYAAVVRGSQDLEIKDEKFIAVDPEAPLNGQFYYEVYTNNGGRYTTRPCEAAYDIKQPSSPHCVPVLISDPLVVDAMQWVDLMSIDPLSYPARMELADVISRAAPVALTGVRSTARTTFRVLTRTREQRDNFLSLFRSGRILFYRNPDPNYPENNWYIAVGDITENRVHPDHGRPERIWDIEVSVVDRPEGLLVGADLRTYADVRDFEPDGTTPISPDEYAGLIPDYREYLDVLLGGRGGTTTPQSFNVDRLVYGGGRYPTRKAAQTSWSLRP